MADEKITVRKMYVLMPNDTPVDKPALYLRLLAVADPLGRAIAELHQPKPHSIREDLTVPWWECDGCDFGGYDGERPQWPCRTVDALAEHYGVEEAT